MRRIVPPFMVLFAMLAFVIIAGRYKDQCNPSKCDETGTCACKSCNEHTDEKK